MLPHVGMLLLPLRVQGGGGRLGLDNSVAFFAEQLSWRMFARTAVYPVLATLLTPVVAFPVACCLA